MRFNEPEVLWIFKAISDRGRYRITVDNDCISIDDKFYFLTLHQKNQILFWLLDLILSFIYIIILIALECIYICIFLK